MRICLIAEGSYPYVVGGVSSWVQSLITAMPEHEFIIYAIGADEKDKGNFKYELPVNLIEVRETFLNTGMAWSGRQGKGSVLSEREKQAIKSLLVSDHGNWEALFSIFKKRNRKFHSAAELVTSQDFLDIVKELCIESYVELPFTQLYWSVRSMLLPLISVLSYPPPKADLYHSVSTGYAGIIGSFCKHYYGSPYVITEHGIYTREREEEIIKSDQIKGPLKMLWIKYFQSLSKGAYASANQVVTLFSANRDIQLEMGCPKEKSCIIPNGVHLGDYIDLPQKTGEDKQFIDIGAVVRIVPIKDIKTMIQSFAIVKRTIPNARFHIMGPVDEDQEYYEECLQLVDFLGLQDIQFTGTVNVKEYLGKMDILVLSSISEGQPLVLLEGMASGKPFVCTDVGSCKELLYGREDSFGQAGYVVSVMDSVGMAREIITLAQNPSLRTRMGESGRWRIHALYSWDNFIEQYRKIYGNRGYLNGGDRIPTQKISG